MQGGVSNIDESVKVKSWDVESPTLPVDQNNFYHKYAAHLPQASYSPPNIEYENENEMNIMDSAFRQLKNEQIQKLRNLKSEYDEIKRITTDYNMPKLHQDSSVQSSGMKSSRHASQLNKVKGIHYNNGGRQTQILQLQKKQLEIMLQNSMKKIQQLLHNQMQYKKNIHQLRLEKQSKHFADNDNQTIKKIFKKKEKELYDQIKILQLERQTLFTQSTSLKEKVKFLESKLSASEQQLRKLLQDKRDYQELLLNQKNKYMHLQIDFQRQKREFQIMEKDKNAHIQQLLRSKDLKESSSDRQLKEINAQLEEDLRTKEKRYVLLLQQIENMQKEKKQQRQNQEQQVKLVNELLSKSSADSSNKALQETLNGILLRLADLQTKPQQPISSLINDLIDEDKKDQATGPQSQQIESLQKVLASNIQRIVYLEQKIRSHSQNNSVLQAENSSLKVQISNLTRKNKNLQESEAILKDQIGRLKQGEKRLSKDSSRDRVGVAPKDDSLSKVSLLMVRIKNLEQQVEDLNSKLLQSNNERDKLDEQNRQLLTKLSKNEFELNKAKQEAQLQTNLTRKELQTTISILQKQLAAERGLHNGTKVDVNNLKFTVNQLKGSEQEQILSLKRRIDSMLRDQNSLQTQLKSKYNSDLELARSEYQDQIDRLTTKIQELSLTNKDLQQQNNNRYNALQ